MVHFSQKEKFFPHVIGKDFIADLKCGFLNMIISGSGRKVRKLSFIHHLSRTFSTQLHLCNCQIVSGQQILNCINLLIQEYINK